MRILLLFIFLNLASCTNGESNVSISQRGSGNEFGMLFFGYVHASDSSLPDCDSFYDKKIYYVALSGEFKYCLNEQWSSITLSESQGDEIVISSYDDINAPFGNFLDKTMTITEAFSETEKRTIVNPLVLNNSAVEVGDSVSVAIGKLQAQITALGMGGAE